jgi:hypothetical protein
MTLRFLSIKLRCLFAVIGLKICLCGASAFAATSISQFGITWKFDKDYTTGQFANGDYWVAGSAVKITSITPRSVVTGGQTMHGSMINPSVNGPQGYDSRMKSNTFSASANVGRAFPLTVPAGSSLLSSESYSTWATGDNPQLKTIAILTVLASPPPAGSFRPAPVGTNKSITWNKSKLNYSKLRSLAPVASTPSLSSVEALFERPWIEQGTTWVSRYMHPGENQPTYGREIAQTLSQGLLSLQLNYSKTQKEKLLVRLVQYGLDIYGSARLGAVWPAGGGHNQGRKMPMLLAGAVLGDSNILSYADGRKLLFQEDRQTFYVTQADVGRALYTGDGRPRVPYIQSDVGLAEWGEKHSQEPQWDGRNWDSYYRTVSSSSTVGHVLTARLMGLKDVWNWPAIFDYNDRYWSIEGSRAGGGANSISSFVAAMWKSYRNADPADFTDENVATEVWQNMSVSSQTGSFTIAFDILPSTDKIDGVTGLSNGAADGHSDIAAGVRFAPSGVIDAPTGSAYKAAGVLRYTAGVKHHVVMTVNIAKKSYSVSVSKPGGSPVVIADNYPFRTEQMSVKTLNNLGFLSVTGYHAVLDMALQPTPTTPPAPTPSTPPAPEPTPPKTSEPSVPVVPPAPPTSGATNLNITKTSSGAWQNAAMPSVKGKATLSFDMVAGGSRIDAITGVTDGPADSYNDFAIAVRFAPHGMFDAINGNSWSKSANVRYVAGQVYRVAITIDVTARRYSATVTAPGGKPITIASNSAFRSSQSSVKQLSNLTLFGASGNHTVSKGTLQIK